MRRLSRLLLGWASVGVVSGHVVRAQQSAQQPPSASPIKHVFVIVLENESYATTFNDSSPAPYLADTLVRRGALLREYYGVGHNSLDNYIAMISGQAPNNFTRADCPVYKEFASRAAALNENGQAVGEGCVYPRGVQTVANQLDAWAGDDASYMASTKRDARQPAWKGYMQDYGNHPKRESAVCGHPDLDQPDRTIRGEPGDHYATKHNPFFYFHSVIDSEYVADSRARCAAHVVNLRQLTVDLVTESTTPALSFISPNLCDDGHDRSCPGEVDTTGGLPRADRFLARWVPVITASPAFQRGGVLVITFDESNTSDTRGCCADTTASGGGRVGAVLLSPLVKPGTVSDRPYNHYSLLKSVEDAFGLGHLGYASSPSVHSFGSDVFGDSSPLATTGPPDTTTFVEYQVDRLPVSDPRNPTPVYPEKLRFAGISGEVVAQFVIDTTGRVDVRTFRVIRSSDVLFSRAVQSAVGSSRFSPAVRAGHKVKILVTLPYGFSVRGSRGQRPETGDQ
jgi:phosphatidylinositol-3-phosphatase